jgi:hypothetical protein
MTALRRIDFSKEKYFECDGKKFEVTESLSFTRYRELQKISLEFGFSATFEDIFNNLKTGIDYYNKHDYFNMSITMYKIQEGIKNLEMKDDPSLRLCALFINEENEDPTKYSEAMMKSKIDSWGGELEISPFFYLAASLVPGWMPSYRLLIQNGSEEKKNESDQNEKESESPKS